MSRNRILTRQYQSLAREAALVTSLSGGETFVFIDEDGLLKRATHQSILGGAAQGAGTANGTGVTAVESGAGGFHKTVLTLADTPIVMADEAGVVGYGGLKVYDFPEGLIVFQGAVMDLDLTKSSAGIDDTWDGDVGLGTVTASNNATLATTEQNLVPTTATPQAVAGATTADAQSTSTEIGTVLDGTTTAIDAFLNFLVDDADHDITATAANIIANGSITMHWIQLGDN